jgi:tetratricopeptide (TPR) repeat protein
MLCKQHKFKKWLRTAVILPITVFNLGAIVWTPLAWSQAQASSSELLEGQISGTVLLKTNNRPASQVAVKLKSHAAGIFRSILTDLEGHFEIKSLPPSTYEIVVDEPGYEPTQTSAQLDGSSTKLVLYLKPSSTAPVSRDRYTISTRELKIPAKAQREFEKGIGSLAKSDFAGSVSHFTKATEAFPEYYEAYYHMGVAEVGLRRRDEARQAFQKAIDLSGGRYAWAEFGVGYVLYLQGKPEEAIAVIRKGLEVDGNSTDGYLVLGMAQLRLNRLDEAERSAREALLRNPNFARAYLVLADVYGQRHEYRAQVQGLETYLRLDPKGAEGEVVRRAREAAMKRLEMAQPEE